MSSHLKSSTLIILGGLFIALAIANTIFDLTGTLSDKIGLYQYSIKQTQNPSIIELDVIPEATISALKTIFAPTPTPGGETSSPQSAAQTPVPTPTQMTLAGYIPDRIIVPAIKLDAPIISAETKSIELRNQWFEQWQAPDEFAVGWNTSSAPLGLPGNTVFFGHHNEYGKVFGKLVNLVVGDTIVIRSGSQVFLYQVSQTMILKEKDVSLEIRQQNAQWINSKDDERITLVTCWPKRNNSHRLIIVALPIKNADADPDFLFNQGT